MLAVKLVGMSYLIRVINYVRRYIRDYIAIKKAKKLGICFVKPNYLYLKNLDTNSIVVDVGCANDPDFSLHALNRFNCKCFGIDPTHKHFSALKIIENEFYNKFFHLDFAVSNTSGKVMFYESLDNVSGSLLEDHINVKNDLKKSYEVEALTLKEMQSRIVGVGGIIDYLKLDLEGAEYDLLYNITPEDLYSVKQLFVEFHHHCIDRYTSTDTEKIVKLISSCGFKIFTIDRHNYLFYKQT